MIYLDYQATTPVDVNVVEAMLPYFTEKYANPSSSSTFGFGVNLEVEKAREIVAQSLNCSPHEIIFTSGATESINTAIKGLFSNENNGHIITLKTEHSAVLETCQYLSRKGIVTTYLDVEKSGLIDLDLFEKSITSNTRLVAIAHVNNEIGVIQPINNIADICSKKGIPLFVDAAQSFGKLKIDVSISKISMLAVSGHKIYAPKGIGVLYVNEKIKHKLEPLLHGGGQEDGLRSGTLNVPNIIGLSKAVEISINKMQCEQDQILRLRNIFLNLMQNKIKDVIINGSMEQRIAGNLSLTFKNVLSDILINNLGNIVISKGSACNSIKNNNSHVLKAIGLSDELIDSSVRISIGRYTQESEIVETVSKMCSIVNSIRATSKI